MKIICRCGEAIIDADASPDKAWLIADQDVEELRAREDALGGGGRRNPPPGGALSLARPVYRCRRCGRLCLADPVDGSILFFAPEAPSPRSPLGSRDGNSHKVALVGGWKDWHEPPSGDLFWGTSGDRPGGYETFDDAEALRRRYHDVLDGLRRENRLASAWLHRGEATLHRWPA